MPGKLAEMGNILAKIRNVLSSKQTAIAAVCDKDRQDDSVSGGNSCDAAGDLTLPPPLVVVMGDHGMADGGGHGGASGPEVLVPLILISDALKASFCHVDCSY